MNSPTPNFKQLLFQIYENYIIPGSDSELNISYDLKQLVLPRREEFMGTEDTKSVLDAFTPLSDFINHLIETNYLSPFNTEINRQKRNIDG